MAPDVAWAAQVGQVLTGVQVWRPHRAIVQLPRWFRAATRLAAVVSRGLDLAVQTAGRPNELLGPLPGTSLGRTDHAVGSTTLSKTAGHMLQINLLLSSPTRHASTFSYLFSIVKINLCYDAPC